MPKHLLTRKHEREMQGRENIVEQKTTKYHRKKRKYRSIYVGATTQLMQLHNLHM